MHPTTAKILEEIIEDARRGYDRIAPATFTAYHPRANVSAAFRIARRRGIIAVNYQSAAGTPVYRASCRLVQSS